MDEMVIQTLAEYFSNIENTDAVYLFGSFAKNKDRKHSDIDIAVLFSVEMNIVERFEKKLRIASELEDIFHRKVDIVDLESADSFFVHKIMEEKVLIYNINVERRVVFEVKKRKDFFDRQKFYNLYNECSMKRLEGM
ncbi:MAG TPA: nucleotidyltransferase domain-containing protein [Clostridiales bacterium]|nr:nucleotidyltransferase domain-containing protein [Clostridiales bacterium]